jgi:hypothetical protein
VAGHVGQRAGLALKGLGLHALDVGDEFGALLQEELLEGVEFFGVEGRLGEGEGDLGRIAAVLAQGGIAA